MAQNKAFSLGGIGAPCCCATPTPTPACNVTICVTDCDGMPLVGAVVTIKSGMTTIGTCTTTDPLGCCAINVVTAGTYTVGIVATGFNDYSRSQSLMCNDSITIPMTPTSNTCECCASQINESTLFLTDSNGTFAMTQIFIAGDPAWTVCYDLTLPGTIGPQPTCNTTGSFDVNVQYLLTCGGPPAIWLLTQSWSVFNSGTCSYATSPCPGNTLSHCNNGDATRTGSTDITDCSLPLSLSFSVGSLSPAGCPIPVGASVVINT